MIVITQNNPVMYTDSTGYFAISLTIWTLITIVSTVLLIVNAIRIYYKMIEINKEMDELIESSTVEYNDFNSLKEDEKYEYINQIARLKAYKDKRSAMKVLNALELFCFIPIKKIDKLGIANDVLEPTKEVPDRLIGKETEAFNWALDNGIQTTDQNFYKYYVHYIESYEYWEGHLYD